MTLLSDVLLGTQEPQLLHLPVDVHSLVEATEAIELAETYGMRPDESQRITLEAWMGTRSDGTWAASQACHAMSRQNGKGDELQIRELAGLVLRDEEIIHTAHEYPTASKAFLRLLPMFTEWDDLRRLVKRVRYANGEQGIELRNGGAISYKARTGGGGRGFDDIGTVIYDEAQHLRPEHIAASSPTMAVHPNPQAIFTGSAAITKFTSAVWWDLRKRGILGHQARIAGVENPDPDFAWVEHTAEFISIDDDSKLHSVKPDPAERRFRAIANPAYNVRIPEKFLASQLKLLRHLFAEEHLGVWAPCPDDEGHDRIVPVDVWAAAGDEPGGVVGRRVLAWDVSPNSAWSSVGWVGERPDGVLQAEVVESKAGTDWVAARLAKYVQGAGPLVVGVAFVGGTPAEALLLDVVAALKTVGVVLEDKKNLFKVSGQAYSAACGDWLNKTSAGVLRHVGQAWLSNAVDGAVWRDTGESRVFDRKNATSEISPLCLSVAALRGLQIAPPVEALSTFAY